MLAVLANTRALHPSHRSARAAHVRRAVNRPKHFRDSPLTSIEDSPLV